MISIPYALDALNFFAADARNALGPFVNVYLVTDRHWSQTEVGVVATTSGLLGIALQTPIGAAIDLTPAKRAVIVIAISAMAFASLIIFGLPTFWPMAVAFARSGDRWRRLCARGRRVDPRGHAQIRSRPASWPQLGVRSCREHRDCHRGGRDRICAFATRGLPDGPGLRNSDDCGCPQHPRERHQSGARERCGLGRQSCHGRTSAAGYGVLFRTRPLVIFALCAFFFHFANAPAPAAGRTKTRASVSERGDRDDVVLHRRCAGRDVANRDSCRAQSRFLGTQADFSHCVRGSADPRGALSTVG